MEKVTRQDGRAGGGFQATGLWDEWGVKEAKLVKKDSEESEDSED